MNKLRIMNKMRMTNKKSRVDCSILFSLILAKHSSTEFSFLCLRMKRVGKVNVKLAFIT